MGSIKLQNELHNKDIQNKIIKMRINGVFYLIGIFVVYYLGILMANDFWKGILGTLYWLVTTFVVNWFSHMDFVYGIKSLFSEKWVVKKIEKRSNDN